MPRGEGVEDEGVDESRGGVRAGDLEGEERGEVRAGDLGGETEAFWVGVRRESLAGE